MQGFLFFFVYNKMNKKDLIYIEEKMDQVNGQYGLKNKLCLFCGSSKYGAYDGITHESDCAILKIRKIINEYDSHNINI